MNLEKRETAQEVVDGLFHSRRSPSIADKRLHQVEFLKCGIFEPSKLSGGIRKNSYGTILTLN